MYSSTFSRSAFDLPVSGLRNLTPGVGFPITICVIFYGPHSALAETFLTQLYRYTDANLFTLRVSLNEVEPRTHQLVAEAASEYGNIEITVSRVNIFKNPMMRRLFYEKPLQSKWLVWFDDDSYPIKSDWLQRFALRMERHSTCSQWGFTYFVRFDDGHPIARYVRQAPWYRNKPFRCSEKGGGLPYRTLFITGAFWAIRTCVVHQLDWPDPGLVHESEDVILGEALHQNNLAFRSFEYGVRINTAPRRNAEVIARLGLNP